MIVLLLLACVGGDATLEVGTGADAFEPLTDGDDLVLVMGPQGGYHVWGSLRATGVVPGDPLNLADPKNPLIGLSLWVNGEMVGGYQGLPRGLREDGDAWVRVGETVVLTGLSVDDALGQTATLRAQLEDATGARLMDEVTGTLTAE